MKQQKITIFPKGFTLRPSSPRSVAVRGIGAVPHLYPAQKPCGMTKCVSHGFTLIELLVVVLIIGILAAVAVPQYQKAVEKARAVQALTVMDSLQKAVDIYVLNNGLPSSNYVDLIGCPDMQDGKCNVLDIAVENALTCDVDGGIKCRSQHFSYNVQCYPTSCSIEANRCKNGDYDNEVEHYTLSMQRDASGKWEKWYNDQQIFPYSSYICNWLEENGWDD